jgi:mono/diheme cytochrome c family protein
MRSYLLGLLGVAALHGGVAQAQQATGPGDPAAGKAVATSLCRTCHLVSPEDRGPVPDGVPSFMAIGGRAGQTEDGVAAAILGPHPIMPQPPIGNRQAADVAAYIMSLGN